MTGAERRALLAEIAAVAVGYAKRGVAVHPIRFVVRDGQLRKIPPGPPKSVDGLGWPGRMSTDHDEVAALFTRWPSPGIVGRVPAGVVVLDIDRHAETDGFTQLAALERIYGPLPATLMARTAGGGEHRWFASTAFLRSTVPDRPGLELKSTTIILAPSFNPVTHRRYAWVEPHVPIALLPGWLQRLAARPVARRRRGHEHPPGGDGLLARFAGHLDAVAAAPVGTRDSTLNRAAFFAGRLVVSRHLDEGEAIDRLAEAGAACGLPAAQVAATVTCGLAAGQRAGRYD